MAYAYLWESFIRIHGGEEGARSMFEHVIDDLLRYENPDKEVHIVRASQGDGGIDVYVEQLDGIDIYQCKFFMGNLNSSRWNQIRNSYNKAMEPKGVKVRSWTLCMPREMQKDDIAKWKSYKKEKEKEFAGVELRYIDGNEIISRMEECDHLKNTTLIDKYFYENRKKHFTNKDLIIPFTMSKANGAQGGTYVPRDDLLTKIEESFKTERIIFLSGIGGCGKSELARAYAHKHLDDYDEVFWLTCDDSDRQPNLYEIMQKANLLNSIEKEEIKRFSDKILIIVDNCNKDKERLLHELELGTGSSKIIVTTRLSYVDGYESIIPVESDDPSSFTFAVFKKNYSKKTRMGISKRIQIDEENSVYDICNAVQYNTMIVSLIGIRLRDSNNLSIASCARKIREGVGSIKGKVRYSKDLETKSLELIDILIFLFSDILDYSFDYDLKAVLTVLSLAPATWYEIDYICSLLDGTDQEKEHRGAIEELLDIGCLQGSIDKITIHPLIAEVISDQHIIISEPAFFTGLLENYLGLSDKYLKKEFSLIKKVYEKAVDSLPQYKIAVKLLHNDDYRRLFEEYCENIRSSYFVYVNYCGNRYFYYRDLDKKENHLLVSIKCAELKSDNVVLLSVYNREGSYTLDLNVSFFGMSIKEIPSGLCYGDTNIIELIISDNTKSIGSYAFCYCKELKGQLNLPDCIKTIGSSAFYYCRSLDGDLYLPDSLTEIGTGAFSGCTSLNGSLHISSSLTKLADYLFSSCRNLTGPLSIPSSLTHIGDYVFDGCRGLKGKVNLSHSLVSIGKYAFQGCEGLYISLQSLMGKTSIGYHAFKGCKGIVFEYHLPERLTNIDTNAIKDCLSDKIYLNESLQDIGDTTLYGCGNRRYIKLFLPEGLTSISNNAFCNCRNLIGEIYLPKSLSIIGDYAFYGCKGLSGELHLPEGLTRIGDYAFYGCKGLSGEIHFPESVASIGDYAFYGCEGLSGELHLPDGLTRIGAYAFSDCDGLSGELHLPKSLKNIRDGVFNGCSGLSGELQLSENITNIGDYAFKACGGLSGELHLPDGLTHIGDYAFYGCKGLSGGLHFPDGLTSIGNLAFYACTHLSGEMHLPKTVKFVGEYAFTGCNELRTETQVLRSLSNDVIDENDSNTSLIEGIVKSNGKIYLPEGLLKITEGAFFMADLSGELHLPDGLTTIEDYAFNGCTGLNGELYLPNSLTVIGDYAFSGCKGFNGSLNPSDSLMSIGRWAFYGCTGLREIRLPKSLISIGEYAFYGCSSLSGELRLPPNLTSIGANAFAGCNSLSGKLFLPEHLRSILDGVFYDCSNLIGNLMLPDSLTNIGNRAFQGCKGLSGELHLPKGLLYIGNYAFSGCNGLSGELHLPKSLVSIGANAFYDCYNIKRIVFNNPNTDILGVMNPLSSIISGYKNSTAEKYAKEAGMFFEEIKTEE